MNDKKRILHVDDEPDILETVKTILENEGFEVVSVDSGKEALKQIKSNNFRAAGSWNYNDIAQF
ncbi:response regulator [Patescibacteria group bacterium]|nr:response regulator [Patescibacteria group bacterium]